MDTWMYLYMVGVAASRNLTYTMVVLCFTLSRGILWYILVRSGFDDHHAKGVNDNKPLIPS